MAGSSSTEVKLALSLLEHLLELLNIFMTDGLECEVCSRTDGCLGREQIIFLLSADLNLEAEETDDWREDDWKMLL